MNEIALHIDYLLHKHDCVIIPNLGGFVVNSTHFERDGIWGVNAPTYELLFNKKLSYNDGLLAESLMRVKNISFNEAMKEIKCAIDKLKTTLQEDKVVEWENLGHFTVDKEGALTFESQPFIRPKSYSLTNVRPKPASLSITQVDEKADINSMSVAQLFKYVSTAVAIGLLFFFIAVSYSNYNDKNQYAEIISKPLIFYNKSNNVAQSQQLTKQTDVIKEEPLTDKDISLIKPTVNSINSEKSVVNNYDNYFIIIGVYTVPEIAEKSLDELKKIGFNSASMIKKTNRMDVYVDSFDDKKEAQTFLKRFREENPRYHDAWLLER